MTDLEQRLADLSGHLDVPAGHGLPATVTARLAADGDQRDPRRRRWWRWIAGAIVVGAGIGVTPAVADWLGVGGVAVHRDPPPPVPTVRFDPGRPVALADVALIAGFEPILPGVLGPPDDVWIDDRGASPLVWLRWDGGPLITQLDRSPGDGPVIQKHAPGSEIEQVRVGDVEALWVGGPHLIVLERQDAPASAIQQVSEGTLVLEMGSVTIRIESRAGRDEAVRIASSLPGT